MGAKDDFIAVTILKKIACCVLCIALLFIWIAFTCTGWGEQDTSTSTSMRYHIGLWRQCPGTILASNGNGQLECTSLDGYALDWFGFTQASAIFGFIGINVATILVCLAIFSARWKDNQENFFFIASILCLGTGVFFFIGIIVFGAKFKEEFVDLRSYRFSYAFGLAIVGCIAQITVGVLLLVDKQMEKKQKVNQNPSE